MIIKSFVREYVEQVVKGYAERIGLTMRVETITEDTLLVVARGYKNKGFASLIYLPDLINEEI